MNLLSHAFFILAFSEVLNLELSYALIGALLPDIDYLIGVNHRTFMHSLLFAAILVFISFKKGKRKSISLLIGFLTHLTLDVLTTQGVQLLWPVNTFFSFSLFNSMDNNANLLLIILSLIVLLNKNVIIDKLSSIKPERLRFTVFAVLAAPLIFSIPYTLLQNSSCKTTGLENIFENINEYSEVCVKVSGFICSGLNTYTSSSSNNYKIFTLCEGGYNITIWAIDSVVPELKKYDNVTITGLFTKKFLKSSGYEIYMVKEIRKD